MATGSKTTWTTSVCLLFFCVSYSFANNVNISGVTNGIVGDYERFTCDFIPDSESEVVWMYKLKNGTSVPVEESDLTTVTADDDPCLKAQASEREGKPVTVVHTTSPALLSPYRKSHYIDGHVLKVIYPTEVSQVRLTCFSSRDTPAWSIKKDDISKMKFAAWAQPSLGSDCKQQVLEIYEVKGHPGSEVNFQLECRAGSTSSSMDLTFKFADIVNTRIEDLNSTENCVNQIVDQFYNKELTGVSVASSFVIILMMAGIAVMKKQLNQQQSINQELQNKPSSSGGVNSGSTGPPPA